MDNDEEWVLSFNEKEYKCTINKLKNYVEVLTENEFFDKDILKNSNDIYLYDSTNSDIKFKLEIGNVSKHKFDAFYFGVIVNDFEIIHLKTLTYQKRRVRFLNE